MKIYITRRTQTSVQMAVPVAGAGTNNTLVGMALAMAGLNTNPAIGGTGQYAGLQAATFPKALIAANADQMNGVTVIGYDSHNNLINIPFTYVAGVVTFGGGASYSNMDLMSLQFPGLKGQASVIGYDNGDMAWLATVNRSSNFPNGTQEVVNDTVTSKNISGLKSLAFASSSSIPYCAGTFQYIKGIAGIESVGLNSTYNGPDGTAAGSMRMIGFTNEYIGIEIDDNYLTLAQQSGKPIYVIANGSFRNYEYYKGNDPDGFPLIANKQFGYAPQAIAVKVDGNTAVSAQDAQIGDLFTEAAVSMGKVDTNTDVTLGYQSNPAIKLDGALL